MKQSRILVESQFARTGFVIIGFAGLMCLIAFRLYALQVEQGQEMRMKAESRAVRSWTLPAARGDIFDCEGMPLAVSVPRWNLYADPSYMTDKLQACIEISRICQIPREDLRRHFEKNNNGRLVVKQLSDKQRDAVSQLKLEGIYARRSYDRVHPIGSLAPQVIGFVLDSGLGGAGIEQYYHSTLAATNGREKFYVDSRNRPMYHKVREKQLGIDGANIQLTIDAHVQRKAQEVLQATIEHHQADKGSLIVVRPESGEIVAMASWPTFDLEDFTTVDPESYRNQNLQFVYESGSTMKPLIAAAAIAEGKTSINERIFCENGKFTKRIGRGKRTVHDHSYKHGGHQYLTVMEGIAVSDNVLMAKLGLRMGPDLLYDWTAVKWGFGKRTGIELPGEDAGIVRAKRKWDKLGSCMSIPMGHEMAVTPLQMVMAHCAIANGGVWNPPRIVRSMYRINESGQRSLLPIDQPPVSRRVLNRKVARDIRMAMNKTMTDGTGRKQAFEQWTSAGKTGTTEKLVDVEVNGRMVKKYSKDIHIGSFVCFAPASDIAKAEFVCLVVIDNPTENGHYGSQTAAPAVHEVMQFALEHARIKSDVIEPVSARGRR
ncbi:MAG: penicillin-binding protein 2 [Planctomycetes bacterium]|nr:penicillin-binding protein 2 [Planctomycetota bacterium]